MNVQKLCNLMMVRRSRAKMADLDWLTFSATEPSSRIRLFATSAELTLPSLEYSYNGAIWNRYNFNNTAGDWLDVPDNGLVKFRAWDINPTFSWGGSKRISFESEGSKPFLCTGNIMTLYNKSKIEDTVPDVHYFGSLFMGDVVSSAPILPSVLKRGCLQRMFYNNRALKTAAQITSRIIPSSACMYMYYGCISLIDPSDFSQIEEISIQGCMNMYQQSGLTMPADLKNVRSYGAQACYQMYMDCTSLTKASYISDQASLDWFAWREAYVGCSKLHEIHVDIHSWHEDLSVFQDWVKGVSPSGKFICPADLPKIYDDSHIPVGWEVINV